MDKDAISDSGKPQRKPFRISLRMLLGVITVLAIVAVIARVHVRQEEAIAEIVRRGGSIAQRTDRKTVWKVDLEQAQEPDVALWYAAHLRDVEVLRLRNTWIADEDLARLRRLSKLTRLYLASTGITDDGLRYLASLRDLKTLELSSTNISDAGLKHLATLHNLTSLSLNGTAVTDEGLRQLDSLKRLRFLNISDTRVTGQGVAHLEQLAEIDQLCLDARQVTDESVKCLQGLRHLVMVEVRVDDGTGKSARDRLVSLPKATLRGYLRFGGPIVWNDTIPWDDCTGGVAERLALAADLSPTEVDLVLGPLAEAAPMGTLRKSVNSWDASYSTASVEEAANPIESVAALVQAVIEGDATNLRQVKRYIDVHGGDEANPALLELLETPSPELRQRIKVREETLRRFGAHSPTDPQAVDAEITALRARLACILFRTGSSDPQVARGLHRLFETGDPIRATVIDGLGWMMTTDSRHVTWPIAADTATLALDLILPLAGDEEVRVRWAVADALGNLAASFPTDEEIPDTRMSAVMAALLELLEDADTDVRSYAISAVERIADHRPQAAQPFALGLLKHLEKFDEDPASLYNTASLGRAIGLVLRCDADLTAQNVSNLIQTVHSANANAASAASASLTPIVEQHPSQLKPIVQGLIRDRDDPSAPLSPAVSSAIVSIAHFLHGQKPRDISP